jgi:hypothetical protein
VYDFENSQVLHHDDDYRNEHGTNHVPEISIEKEAEDVQPDIDENFDPDCSIQDLQIDENELKELHNIMEEKCQDTQCPSTEHVSPCDELYNSLILNNNIAHSPLKINNLDEQASQRATEETNCLGSMVETTLLDFEASDDDEISLHPDSEDMMAEEVDIVTEEISDKNKLNFYTESQEEQKDKLNKMEADNESYEGIIQVPKPIVGTTSKIFGENIDAKELLSNLSLTSQELWLVKLNVNPKHFGRLIGSEHKNIKTIREKYDYLVDIRFPSSKDTEKDIVNIFGTKHAVLDVKMYLE